MVGFAIGSERDTGADSKQTRDADGADGAKLTQVLVDLADTEAGASGRDAVGNEKRGAELSQITKQLF